MKVLIPMGSNENNKKTRKKRAIKIDEGVLGTEISLFTKSVKEPSIKVSYLYKGKDIYKNVIKIYFNHKYIDDLDILNYCNLLNIAFNIETVRKTSEIFQVISKVFSGKQVINFAKRELNLIPYQQVTITPRGFVKYSEIIKKEFFENKLKEKVKM